jgi:hypothetical protein
MSNTKTVTATDNTIDLATVTGGVRADANGVGCTEPRRPFPSPFPSPLPGPRNPFPSPFPGPRNPFPGPRDPLGPILGGGRAGSGAE